jgi:hypothetical protein
MRPRALTTAIAAAAVAALAAGCGGSSPGSTVANVGATPAMTSTGPASSKGDRGSPAAFFSQAIKFSQCMRSHGIPDFPDPKQSGNGISLSLRGSKNGDLNPNSHQFQAAQQACRAYAPAPAANAPPNPRLAQQALAFARCMRSHGVPNFPDPKVSGNNLQLGGPGRQGFDPNSPQFQAAQSACKSSLPGAGGSLSTGSGDASGSK